MKAMGKIAALAMAVGMAFVLTACGGSGSSSSAAASSASASASSASASASAGAVASPESASASGASAEASVSAADATTYDNDFFGIRFELPEGWAFTDQESLAETNSAIGSIDAVTSIDMVATAPDKTITVTVGLEKATEENSGTTAEAHLETDVNEMIQGASEKGISYLSESATITFKGTDQTAPASLTTFTIDDSTLCVGIAIMEKEGNFFDIIVSGPNEESVNNAFSYFELIQ